MDDSMAPEQREVMSKIAVITGGGRGIGRAVATSLCDDGWSIVVCGRTQTALDETVDSLTGAALAVVADVSRSDDVEHLFDATIERFGRIDLLFNNAGITAPPVPIDELEVEVWDRLMAVNVRGSFLCARAAFGRMRRQEPAGGRIINNGSISATTPRPFSAPYTASKHAITGLTKSLSLDGRDIGITCGQIDIGNAASGMVEQMSAGTLQADGSMRPESTMDLKNVGSAVAYMASLPPGVNALHVTVMANGMPFVGRG